ncbi:DNA-binding transcriptional regulator, XRE-family HTH domain [Flexibacter flexilis DSM 6793]|uniref:DNA-binding transcriptional regulator, XRE-family HTH domain n=1 Tax=Flexibacter flexilis DSM 6793 TaxID=927664 RepID=A0A1I1DG64_9BACT|nr:LexA family transcriptional regulator [Flexibacter flexilis]SFB72048.1 DNA-binding transcriptional regulator, XRE-family HTH domain [Flexibacter flexilis DSM 6793]
MTIGKRIQEQRKIIGLSQQELAQKTGTSRSLVAQIETDKTNPNLEFLTEIVKIFNTTFEYLITGQQQRPVNVHLTNNTISRIDAPQQIEQLIGTNHSEHLIPFYNIDALEVSVDELEPNNIIPDFYWSMPGYRGCKSLPAWGESMTKLIYPGDIIVFREIQDKSIINYGDIYVIITQDYRFIKYIRKHTDKSYVILEAENRESYEPFELERDKIIHLFHIKAWFKRHSM